MNNCLSFHIFQNPPFDKFLKYSIEPLVKLLKRKGLVNYYFFIRYYENGPHIRLRLFLIDQNQKKQTEEIVLTFLHRFFALHNYLKISDKQYVVAPNKYYCVEESQYTPEIQRYGGNYGITIAEKLFHVSSETVLKCYTKKDTLDSDVALGIAMQMHWLFIRKILNFSKDDIALLLNSTIKIWLSRVVGYKESMELSIYIDRTAETLDAFELAYQNQKSQILKIFLDLDFSLHNKRKLPSWLEYWHQNLVLLSAQLNSFLAEFHSIDNTNKYTIVDSYIHMTNNRLGVSNKDESFISFLLLKAFEDLGYFT